MPDTRYVVNLSTRGAKFVSSNHNTDGASAKLTIPELRVLRATGMVTLTAPMANSYSPSTGITTPAPTLSIRGFGFGKQGANSRVTIGAVVCPILSWTDEFITCTATRGATAISTPTAITVRNDAMQTVSPGNFTFTA